jgi:hypothetical protein
MFSRSAWLVLGLASFCAVGAQGAEPAPEATSRLGINLGGLAYWTTEHAFVDAMKEASKWRAQPPGQPFSWDHPLPPMREDGYPKSLPSGTYLEALLFVGEHPHPHGRYLALYDGRGTLEFHGAARAGAGQPGRIPVEVVPNGQISVRITRTDPENPLHNVRLIPASAETTYASNPFRDDFLNLWRGMSALRFMDWVATNNSKVAHWSDRPLVSDTSYTLKGVPVEVMVDLANSLKADPWFTIPHLADDDYVRRFAALVKERLDPTLRPHIEYSNECWNGMFEQARYCQRKGKELKLSNNEYQAQLRYYSKRAVEIFRIWESVFGGTDRLVRVLAAQSVNPWTSEQVVEFEGAAKHADALAIAPYFGNDFGDPKKADETAQLTVDQLLEGCRKAVARNREVKEKQAAIARKHGLKLMAYEGGQHLAGYAGAENDERLTRLFHAANRAPGMKAVYEQDLADWRAVGGDLFMVFASVGAYSKWGSWGLLEYDAQPIETAPKYQAVRAAMGAGARRP